MIEITNLRRRREWWSGEIYKVKNNVIIIKIHYNRLYYKEANKNKNKFFY